MYVVPNENVLNFDSRKKKETKNKKKLRGKNQKLKISTRKANNKISTFVSLYN